MKPRCSNQRDLALTITEVLVVVASLSLLAVAALAQAVNSNANSQQQACVRNLMWIGLACRAWAGDNGDKYPAQVSDRLGGAKESAERGDVVRIFQVMSNGLSTPKTLVCPADTNRVSADSFNSNFNGSHVSYFFGIDAGGFHRQWLSGDSNLAVSGKPVKTGLLLLATNDVVTWTAERHINRGNIGLADGSVAVSSPPKWLPLRQLLTETHLATNRLAVP